MSNFFQDSKVEWLGNIPNHWFVTKLKNQCQIIPSNVDKKSHDNEIEVALCNYVDVYYNDFITDSLNFMIATANEHELQKFQLIEEDVILTKDSEDPYDIAVPALVVSTQPKLLCGYHLSIIRSNNQNFNGSYLFWVLRDRSIASQLHRQATGITRWAIAIKHVKNCSIPFPPISEQKIISAYLDKTCAAIDKAIEAKQKQLEILDALRKSIIHKAVTRGLDDSVELKDSGVEWLGRIPKHWNCKHLKRVCSKIQTGNTPPTANIEYYIDGTIPWYAPGCYDGGIYLQKPAKEINEVAYFNNKLRMFPANSIFIIGIGATIGKVAMTRVEASCNQQIIALVCNSNVYAKYLAYHLKIFETIIPRIAQFTTLPIMDQNKIGYLQIVVPPIKEQRKITNFLDNKIVINNRLENNLVNQISTLNQYRKSLIHECVTGKRRINEDLSSSK